MMIEFDDDDDDEEEEEDGGRRRRRIMKIKTAMMVTMKKMRNVVLTLTIIWYKQRSKSVGPMTNVIKR